MKTVQVRKNAFLMLGVLALVTLVMSGCLKEGTSSSTSTPKTYISLMHLAPWAPPVQVYFDDKQASSAINPGTVATTYSALDPGVYAISFKTTADSLVANLGTNLYDTLRYYTLLLYNTDSMHVAAARIYDDFSVLSADKAVFRFFHMSPDVGDVDVYLNNTMVASGRSYADNTSSDYYNQFTPVAADTYTVSVKAAGTDSLIGQSISVPMNIQNAYTIYLKGKKNGTDVNSIGVDYLIAAD
jgi:hypothetical protein